MVRLLLAAAYAVYLLTVAFLVWNPDSFVPSAGVVLLSELLARLDLPASPVRLEFGLNVVMFVPMSLLGGLLFTRRTPGDWVATGFLASVLIEIVQRVLLPTRTGSSRDIVANTLGALVGITAVLVLRALRQERADRMAG